jgi:hypothetical protein
MGKKKKDSSSKSKQGSTQNIEGLIWVDPAWIRFQHSRIRPTFSVCGRTLLDTLNSIRSGDISPFDLPPIQVSVELSTSYGKLRTTFTYPNLKYLLFFIALILRPIFDKGSGWTGNRKQQMVLFLEQP